MTTAGPCAGGFFAPEFPLRRSTDSRRFPEQRFSIMSIVSTLDQARDFLLLSPEIAPASVLLAAQEREAELRAKNSDAKAPTVARQGAGRKLKLLLPLLPALEVEVELAALEASSALPAGPHIHRLRLEHKNLAGRVTALPPGDERSIFIERLSVVQEALQPKQPLPPPPPVIASDPALAVFAAKLAALRLALGTKDTHKSCLTGLLAEARGVASVLRDEAARQQADGQLDDLGRLIDALSKSAPPPPPPEPEDPTEKILAEKIRILRLAVDKKDRSRAPFLLDAARDLASVLRAATAREKAATDLDELAAIVATLLAPPPPDPAEKGFAETVAALRNAIVERRDIASIGELLTVARVGFAKIQSPEARRLCESELASAAAEFSRHETVVRGRAIQAALTELFTGIRQALTRRDQPAALRSLTEARRRAAELPEAGAREIVLAEIVRLTAEAESAPPPLVPPLIKPDSALVLCLVPRAGTAFTGPLQLPLRFVARPRFLLGKELLESASLADFLAPNHFKAVARIQAVLSIRGEEVMIQDGNGELRSANGTKLDDETLPASPVPASFLRERSLVLGTVFALAAQHVPGDAPGGPPLGAAVQVSLNRTLVIKTLTGAMRFLAKGDFPLPLVAVWLFTDATIGSAPTCAVPLPNAGLAETHARLHHWQDGFWIENLRSGATVRIGDHTLTKGEARPLRQADVLRLGNISYDVQVEN